MVRYRSWATDGVTVSAVAGVNTVSFGLRVSARARRGLLGFAVQRRAPGGRFRYVTGFKVFRSIVPDPAPGERYSTRRQPIQSLVWDDFTLQPDTVYTYRFIPMRGTPAHPEYGRPVEIEVRSEPLAGERHTIAFNRGVASSQAYAARFGDLAPDKQPTAAKRQLALDWLSRDLDDTLIAFIREAGPGDALHGAFYEFRYAPVLVELKAAIDRGVDVRLVIDLKVNEHWAKEKQADGSIVRVLVPSNPAAANLVAIAAAGLPDTAIIPRTARRSDLQHNKFLILRPAAQGLRPVAVWTGSTNLTVGGVHGQSNLGHLVRDIGVANSFADYWDLLAADPGARAGESRTDARRRNVAFIDAVDALASVPVARADIPHGVTTIFSPRSSEAALSLYAELLAHPAQLACATFAFGIAKQLEDVLVQGDQNSPLRFFLLEKRRAPRRGTPTVELDSRRNIYQAWGSELETTLGQWVAETTTRALRLNTHVAFIHNKFLLSDPLGLDPVVVSGSANFSRASSVANDENMLVIRGDRRVADIYFTEFNRLFFHYYFRSVLERLGEADRVGARGAPSASSLDLVEDDSWLAKYAPGTLRSKRADLFVRMRGTVRSGPRPEA